MELPAAVGEAQMITMIAMTITIPETTITITTGPGKEPSNSADESMA
jgi:hypothetical protein